MSFLGGDNNPFNIVILKFQSDQILVGNVPRTLSVMCRGELTCLAQPGDHVSVTGIFLPLAQAGFHGMMQGLMTDTY